MIAMRREFVSMNRGVENIGGRLRKGGATFSREDSHSNARKANVHRHLLRARSKTLHHIWAAGDATQQTSNPARRGSQRRKTDVSFLPKLP
jgi:hypothetical protein